MNRALTYTLSLCALSLAACFPGPSVDSGRQSDVKATSASSSGPLRRPIESAAFYGLTHAWIVTGEKGLLCTHDGGQNWERTAAESVGGFERVSFIDGERGWTINVHGQVWFTQDSGLTWTLITSIGNGRGFAVDQIKFEDQDTGWFLEPFDIWRTTDGGASWSQKEFQTPLADACFVNDQVAWVFDQDNRFFQFSDGGNTAQIKYTPGEDGDIRSVFCISGSKGWLARDQRHIKNAPAQLFYTEDGGETWHRQKLPGYKTDLDVVYFRDEKEGWAAGSENESASADGLKAILLHTVDGGQTWKREEVGAQELDFQAVYFSDPLTGWLVGYDKVFRTDDGGANWRLVLNVHATTAKN